MSKSAFDLSGMRFGKLTVIKRAENAAMPCGRTRPMWECLCDCGNKKVIDARSLKRGISKSCGCSSRGNNYYSGVTISSAAAAAAAKSRQSCPTLCDPIDGSPPGSPVPRILQARTLEWVATAFSKTWTRGQQFILFFCVEKHSPLV